MRTQSGCSMSDPGRWVTGVEWRVVCVRIRISSEKILFLRKDPEESMAWDYRLLLTW